MPEPCGTCRSAHKSSDNQQEFTTFLRNEFATISNPLLGQLLKLVCFYHADGCARALLELEALKGKVHVPLEGIGYSPLDLAALSLSTKMTETFLHYGWDEIHDDHVMAALSLAVDAFSEHDYFQDWAPGNSIYKLLYILCIPELKEGLDAVKFLTLKTKNVEKLGYQCVDQGKIVQLAALLLVAGDQFNTELIDGYRNPVNDYLLTKKMSNPTRSPRFPDRRLFYIQSRMGKLFQVLMETRELVESFRNSEECMCAQRYRLPRLLGQKLMGELGVSLTSSEITPEDIKCLAFQLSPEEKSGLEDAVKEKMRLTSESPTNGPIHYTTWRPDKNDDAFLDGDSLAEIRSALAQDDKDVFVQLMSKFKFTDYSRRTRDLGLTAIGCDSVKCATAMLGGELNIPTDFHWSRDGQSPLHLTALKVFPGMTALFLERGEDANVRCDCADSNLKDALPLNIALDLIRKMWCITEWPKTNSIIDLLSELCKLRASLENVRLLVQKTQGVKGEFLKYVHSGSLVQLCVLLIVAHKEFDSFIHQPNTIWVRGRMSYSPVVAGNRVCDKSQNYQMDKQILLLFHIFNKIGDQIGAYVQLEDSKTLAWTKLELTWLMEKAGLIVNGDFTYNYMNDDLRREVKSAVDVKYFDFYSQRHYLGLPILASTKQAPSIMLSNYNVSRQFYTSAVKAHSKRLIKVAQYPLSSNHHTSILALVRKGLRRI